MYTLNSLPQNYKPYDSLNLCSNRILGGGHIFSVGDKLPLIIGAGVKPQIWLFAVADPKKGKFVPLVDSSVSKHPWVRVEEIGRQLLVKVHGATVLRIEQTGEGQAVVSELDLRSVGFTIHGGASSLTIGGMTFSGSTFEQVGVVAGFKG
ncbi:hypothetical protein [Pseudomonas putida]|uniref:hypothetical protein n=1 Tax=Pseudomonas putida TaxID=303 RepID=UPI0018D5F8EF|nr:hypothetical protein [Pseudomonas putida]MBH3412860.1 hypothetical protein [Pseudomonas putida]